MHLQKVMGIHEQENVPTLDLQGDVFSVCSFHVSPMLTYNVLTAHTTLHTCTWGPLPAETPRYGLRRQRQQDCYIFQSCHFRLASRWHIP